MSNAPEEFEELRKLLKLKRYEQPPPRFFNDFSSRVINGIEAEMKGGSSPSLWKHLPWLARFLRSVETNALVAGSFATAICATLIGGIFYSEGVDDQVSAASATASVNGASPVQVADGQTGNFSRPNDTVFASTNAFLTSMPGGSPFDAVLGSLSATPASYTLPQQ